MFGISDWPRPFSPEINKKASHQPTTYFKMAAKEIHPRKMIFIPPLILIRCESPGYNICLRVRAWFWTWLTTIKPLVFFIKNRVCLTSFAAGLFIKLIASLRINKNCYLNFGLPSFIVSKHGTSKARYCVSYDIIWKKNIFAFVLSAEKFSGCLKSL